MSILKKTLSKVKRKKKKQWRGKNSLWAGRVSQVVDFLASKGETLS
jgi:hypothetical protein